MTAQSPETPDLLAWMPSKDAGSDEILDSFLRFIEAKGLTLYPAQEEAILELSADKHVILNTPTGSGKSLVATALHFRAMCLGERSFYTCPIKALVSEKFFDLCALFGADQVGMLTGDASINHEAPIICCTAEVLASIALSEGDAADVDQVVMDEFHYYSDPDRGMAWQLPLLSLPDTTFLLMSATLGDMDALATQLTDFTDREVAHVRSAERPVPLQFEYRETPLHQTVASLAEGGQTPVYVVSFTQREAAELAQGLSSFAFTTRAGREKIAAELRGIRFDSPYGPDIKRLLHNGIGLHHAGLLPKYRRVVERLAQDGLLTVICGTDTLGVGINIPIRTVVFTKLCKFDGSGVKRLSVREFKQIAGRAGRKGFDDRGTVLCQAPPHVIENRQLEAKFADNPKKKKKLAFKKPPEKGYVHWDEGVFRQLIERDPEPLTSRFTVNHGMLLNLLKARANERHGGYGALVQLIGRSHDRLPEKRAHRRHAKQVFQSLHEAQVIHLQPRDHGGQRVVVDEDLQEDFSLHQSLSLYLLDALDLLDQEQETYAMDVISLLEAILEHPRPVLYAQERKVKSELVARLKAEGAEYEERMAELEQVSYPKPNADFIYDTFNAYAAKHPWLSGDNVRPKSVAREMVETYSSFSNYVKTYGLKGSEGVLLRYLSQAYKALLQSIPERFIDDELLDALSFLRATLERVDSSLLHEWEALRSGSDAAADEPQITMAVQLSRDPRALRARIRAEVHLLLKALSQEDYEEAAQSVRVSSDSENVWDEGRFEKALTPYLKEYGEPPKFDHRSRFSDRTLVQEVGTRQYRVRQLFDAPDSDCTWFIEATVDLDGQGDLEGPLLQMVSLGE